MSIQIQTTTDALDLFVSRGRCLKYERLQALFLHADGTLIHHTVVSRGTTNQTRLCIRTVLGSALALGAHSFMLAHNHPNGNPEPSLLDVRATYRLMEAAQVVGLTLLDHLIITATDHRSMRAMGMFPTQSA